MDRLKMLAAIVEKCAEELKSADVGSDKRRVFLDLANAY